MDISISFMKFHGFSGLNHFFLVLMIYVIKNEIYQQEKSFIVQNNLLGNFKDWTTFF